MVNVWQYEDIPTNTGYIPDDAVEDEHYKSLINNQNKEAICLNLQNLASKLLAKQIQR